MLWMDIFLVNTLLQEFENDMRILEVTFMEAMCTYDLRMTPIARVEGAFKNRGKCWSAANKKARSKYALISGIFSQQAVLANKCAFVTVHSLNTQNVLFGLHRSFNKITVKSFDSANSRSLA